MPMLHSANASRVVSVQVLPCYEDEGCVVPQFEGPTPLTEFWSVYERRENGCASIVDDFDKQSEAFDAAERLAAKHGVEIEQLPWMTCP